MRSRLCALIAPAGFGKTVLLHEVRRNTAGAHVLLELSANVETLFFFLYELSCALEPLAPGIKIAFAPAYERAFAGTNPEQSLAAWLHQHLHGMRVTIFLDQLQYVQEKDRIAQFLRAAIETRGSSVRWVLAGRDDLGLPLERWKAAGAMKPPIESDAMRFDFYDLVRAAASMRIQKPHRELKEFFKETGGWPMGVMLSLQSAHAVPNEEAYRSLIDHIYAKRSAREQEFLKATCLFVSFDHMLCKAAGYPDSQKIVDALDDDASFIFVRCESDMLQYHDAFAAYLQARLGDPGGPGIAAALKNAVSALETAGNPRSALLLAMRLGGSKQIARALASSSRQLLEAGHRELVAQALALIDPAEPALSSVVLAVKAIAETR